MADVTQFTVGDKVRCIDASGSDGLLSKGNIYTVENCWRPAYCGYLMNLKGITQRWSPDRFELAAKAEPQAVPEPSKVQSGVTRELHLSVASYSVTKTQRSVIIHNKEDGSDLLVPIAVLPEFLNLMNAVQTEFNTYDHPQP